jgi:hypothetical protein
MNRLFPLGKGVLERFGFAMNEDDDTTFFLT